MKVVCIKSTVSNKGGYTVSKVYPIIEVISDDINVYTGRASTRYILKNDNGVKCAWSYGPGNGTLYTEFAEYFCDLRSYNLEKL